MVYENAENKTVLHCLSVHGEVALARTLWETTLDDFKSIFFNGFTNIAYDPITRSLYSNVINNNNNLFLMVVNVDTGVWELKDPRPDGYTDSTVIVNIGNGKLLTLGGNSETSSYFYDTKEDKWILTKAFLEEFKDKDLYTYRRRDGKISFIPINDHDVNYMIYDPIKDLFIKVSKSDPQPTGKVFFRNFDNIIFRTTELENATIYRYK